MPKENLQEQYEQQFIARTRAARRQKFGAGWEMGEALGLGLGKDAQSAYTKYETRTPLPHHLIPRFCKICSVTVEWFVLGAGPGPVVLPLPQPKPRRATAKQPRRRAAAG